MSQFAEAKVAEVVRVCCIRCNFAVFCKDL